MHTSDLDVLDATDTSIGMVYLCRRTLLNRPDTDVFEIRIDGALLMSSLNPVSERVLTEDGLELHGGQGPLRVLVGGLGLGYTAQAALLDHRVKSVRVIDKLDFVIRWMQQGLLPMSAALNVPHVELVQADVYAMLLAPPTETYDLILIDVDHEPDRPLDPASAPFYTPAGQRLVAKHLAPGGVLGVWSASDHDGFAQVLSQVYEKSTRRYVSWTNDVPGETSEPFENVNFYATCPR